MAQKVRYEKSRALDKYHFAISPAERGLVLVEDARDAGEDRGVRRVDVLRRRLPDIQHGV